MIYNFYSDNFGNIRHAWPEKSGFKINRDNGIPCYTFLHFYTPVEITINGTTIHTESNACILIEKDISNKIFSNIDMIHDWFHLDDCSAQKWLAIGLKFNTIYYPTSPENITSNIRNIEYEYIVKKPFYEKIIENQIENLFINISRSLNTKLELLDQDNNKAIQRLRLEMFRTLKFNWTVKNMAEKINLSESHFFALYKKNYGLSPMRDLINARITAAKNLLMFTDRKISEIAEKTGYSNPYHFSRQFKQITGITPIAFRKQFAKNKHPN